VARDNHATEQLEELDVICGRLSSLDLALMDDPPSPTLARSIKIAVVFGVECENADEVIGVFAANRISATKIVLKRTQVEATKAELKLLQPDMVIVFRMEASTDPQSHELHLLQCVNEELFSVGMVFWACLTGKIQPRLATANFFQHEMNKFTSIIFSETTTSVRFDVANVLTIVQYMHDQAVDIPSVMISRKQAWKDEWKLLDSLLQEISSK